MMKLIYLTIAGICTLCVISCNKFLDVKPKGKQLLETANDYELWLNNENLTIESDAAEINYLGDDIDNPAIKPGSTASIDLIYLWAAQFSLNITASPPFWTDHYANIYLFNTVINGIDKASGSIQQKESLKAEALLGRALEYLYLVNLYGKSYAAATAATDPGVPFVTATDISAATAPRSTVQAIYQQIIADINSAIPALPADNSHDRYRGSVAAAYSVLARAYLYMGEYQQARINAELALKDVSLRMLDYNSLAKRADLPDASVSTANIYARHSGPVNYYLPARPFLKTFDTTDLRLKLFYVNRDTATNKVIPFDYSFPARGFVITNGTSNTTSDYNIGTTVAEMKLIIAEASARSGDLATALQQLNEVRKDRLPGATYRITASDSAKVLQKVLAERSYEFAFNAMRWFDMRRLDAEKRMPAVIRYNAAGNVIATLPPGGTRYVLQIPNAVLKFNPEMAQNP